ncbi:hypothetical protein L7F22_012229 [Adiantum nelumboides]|nr:hypothetical protein [Adiantum nelumboides]
MKDAIKEKDQEKGNTLENVNEGKVEVYNDSSASGTTKKDVDKGEDQEKGINLNEEKVVVSEPKEVARENFKVQNIVASCDVKFNVQIIPFISAHSNFSSYEACFSAINYRMIHPKLTMRIFESGKIMILGAKLVEDIYDAIEKIYPLLTRFKKVPPSLPMSALEARHGTFDGFDSQKLHCKLLEHPSASCLTTQLALGFVVSSYSLHASSNASPISNRLADDCFKVCIYVDDLIIGGDNEGEIMHIKSLLKKEFDMKDLGELRYFLGIEIIHTKEGIWLSQRQYALDMLSKYGMTDCKPISMPLDQNVKLRANEGQVLEDVTMYRQIVGSLIYLTISRPDLSYTVGLESQFMQLPRKTHLDVVRRTLRYVSATLDYALFYEDSTELQLSGFTDADWAGSVCDRQSTSGFMFSLGTAAITWSSKKQPTVALSSTEAEYRGVAVAACEVAWLELLLGDLGIQVQRPIVIHCDNLSSIQLAQNPMFHARTKHIEVHYHFIRERVLDGSIHLTKALGAEKLRRFRAMLGVRELVLSLRGSVEISSSTHGPPG